MKPTHVFYLQQTKRKARKMMYNWVCGAQRCGRQVLVVDCRESKELANGDAVFYGLAPVTKPPWDEVRTRGVPYYYIDNAYLGHRGGYYRVTRNAVQHDGRGASTGWRFDQLKVKVMPWRKGGRHILVTLQSELYHELLMDGRRDDWLGGVLRTLRQHTDRPIMVREKPIPSLPHTYNPIPFEENLRDAWALVTHNSATAVQAILAGVPAIVTDPDCAIAPITTTDLSRVEKPPRPDYDQRRQWASVLADNQWSLEEIRAGTCLRELLRREGR